MTTLKFSPTSELEKFGLAVYNILVEKSGQTFFVGGMVRDLLLEKKVTDIDIATALVPEECVKILKNQRIAIDDTAKKFGVIKALRKSLCIEIATLRKDQYGPSRYPYITFIASPKMDSLRRDITINSLYFKPENQTILDFHEGIPDIKNKRIKFIGHASRRIAEDPLRIVRVLRFALMLNFAIDGPSYRAVKKNFSLVKKLTTAKIKKEILKLKNKKSEIILEKVINNEKLLDKYFKIV